MSNHGPLGHPGGRYSFAPGDYTISVVVHYWVDKKGIVTAATAGAKFAAYNFRVKGGARSGPEWPSQSSSVPIHTMRKPKAFLMHLQAVANLLDARA